MSVVLSLITIVFAAIAAWFARSAFLLKSGLRLRGSHTVTSTIDCDDKFVSSLTIENVKDRAVAIFKIFLEVGHGYYIELEDFGRQPLILAPFEAVTREYGPIEYYSAGMRRIRLNALLDAKPIRKRLVLSTSDGRYVIRERRKHWDPLSLFFQNYLTGIIRPIRSTFKGKAYGSNVRYLVLLKMPSGSEEVIPIRERDYEVRILKKFRIPREALESSATLEEFLLQRAIDGDLRCADVTVQDLESWRREVFEEGGREPIEASSRSWITYHIFGRAYTWWSDYKMRRQNRRAQSKRSATANPKAETSLPQAHSRPGPSDSA
jgi:hypothetical protein